MVAKVEWDHSISLSGPQDYKRERQPYLKNFNSVPASREEALQYSGPETKPSGPKATFSDLSPKFC